MAKKVKFTAEQAIKFQNALANNDTAVLIAIMSDGDELKSFQAYKNSLEIAAKKKEQADKALAQGNFEMTEEDGVVTIVIDTKKCVGASKSGKSFSIASSFGNMEVDIAGVSHSLGLNLYRKPNTAEEIAACEANKEAAKK